MMLKAVLANVVQEFLQLWDLSALGISEASPRACMLTVPQTSTSQALGIRLLLIMLMMVHGTTPKYSSNAVQHCTALTVTSPVIDLHP